MPACGFVMEPIESINPKKDTTFAMMLAALSMGHDIYAMAESDLFIRDEKAFAYVRKIKVFDDTHKWFEVLDEKELQLGELDLIFMRSDPPVNRSYINATYILDQAQLDGAKIVNAPEALRNHNEKIYATLFPDLCPPTFIGTNKRAIRDFVARYERAVIKPLDMMGGQGVYVTQKGDVNLDTLIELETLNGQEPIMAQEFLPGISDGDKRILVIGGEVYPHVLVRVPQQGSLRGNIAAGGSTSVQPISDEEREIAETIAPRLVADGVVFAGLDVIGGKLIEINITSPTGVREISKASGEDVASLIIKASF